MKKYSEAQKKYQSSIRGQEARRKYQESEKGRETHRLYLANRRAKLKAVVQIEQTNPVEKEEKLVKIKVEAVSKK